MKIVIAYSLVLAALGVSGFSDIFDLVHPVINPFASNLHGFKQSARHKRSTVKLELDDPQNCIGKCATQLTVRLSNLNETFTSNASESTKAAALCGAFQPMTPCIQACPKSQLSTMVRDFLPIMSLVCHLKDENYPELLKSIDCINSTKDDITEKCKDKCDPNRAVGDASDSALLTGKKTGSRDSNIHVNLLPSYVVYDDNITRNTENFELACKFLSCTDDCGAPIIKEACGADALQVQTKLTTTVIRSVKALFLDLNATTHDPIECKRYDAVSTKVF